uniref:Uncharacterized protein n=1 Tax=Esox lucius TaxID=8010 RepID=A0AAY5K7V9_ESOLU
MTCSSDANPPVDKYTWYKKTVSSPKASGQSYSITNITSEDSGEYYCEAQNKYGRLNSSTLSVDVQYVDECTAHSQICGENSTCLNTNGSYSCHCLPGFKSNRIGLCVDINECVEEKRYCGNEGLCHNLIGSYWCQCSPGSTNYGHKGTKCVELSCDPQEAQPGKVKPLFLQYI